MELLIWNYVCQCYAWGSLYGAVTLNGEFYTLVRDSSIYKPGDTAVAVKAKAIALVDAVRAYQASAGVRAGQGHPGDLAHAMRDMIWS
jgi:hypothetical protein